MRLVTSLVAIAILFLPALAQDKPAKPTPKEKAAELLQAAFDMAPGVQPEVGATALMRIAENYQGLDDKKAREAMQRAFAVSLGIPPSDDAKRIRVQILVVSAAAKVNVKDAMEMIRQTEPLAYVPIYDPRQRPIDDIVGRLIEEKKFDEAIDFVSSVGVVGQYPYAAAGTIFEKLPKQDLRRSQVFGTAFSVYALRPASPFTDFIVKHWKELPKSSAEAAVEAIVSYALSFKSDEYLLETIGSSKGTLTLRTRTDVELFNIMHLLRSFDKKRAEEILASDPELKAALDRFPDGRASMGQILSINISEDSTPESIQSAMKDSEAGTQLASVMEQVGKLFQFNLPDDEAEKNFMKMLELIKTLPDPGQRAEQLSSIASAVTDEPAIAKSILTDCMEIMKDIKDPDATVEPWNNIADVAHEIKDDKLTGEAIDHALDNAAALLRRDTDPDKPNIGLRDQWPSVNAYRKAAISAVKSFGVDAQWVLTRIEDPDMGLYARVEMAQALLERPHTNWARSYSPQKKK